MRFNSLIIVFFIFNTVCLANDNPTDLDLPPIETFVVEPVVIENISIWVPATKDGPCINQSCTIKKNLKFSSILPASVKHQKTDLCPEQTARILAESTSFYHSQSLPLTIFNGWQWEYNYSMCQYESISYDLAQRGGSWENSLEAILNLSCGIIQLQQLDIESAEKLNIDKTVPSESTIEVKTFNSMRTRDGYPKERQL